MDWRAFEGYEVDGRNVRNVTDAFQLFPEVGLKALVNHGIGKRQHDGRVMVDPNGWYPLPAWLAAFDDILRSVGASKMFVIGKHVFKNSPFPPGLDTIQAALSATDVAYHMNHRKHGKVMFDPTTKTMLDGIGHYRWNLDDANSKRAVMVCNAPYPCDLDRGILSGLALRFEPTAVVEHMAPESCRKSGGEACSYLVSW